MTGAVEWEFKFSRNGKNVRKKQEGNGGSASSSLDNINTRISGFRAIGTTVRVGIWRTVRVAKDKNML